MSTKQQLNKLISEEDFRREFVSDYVQEMLSAQIQALREHRNWTQEELGTAAEGMKQAQVSRLENPDYSGGTIKSLKRLANAFDLGLVVRFVRFSEFLDEITTQSPMRLVPPNYSEEQQQMSFAGFTGDFNWPQETNVFHQTGFTPSYDTLPDYVEPLGSNPALSTLGLEAYVVSTTVRNQGHRVWLGRDPNSEDREFARAA